MTADELKLCLTTLRAYWPADWDDARRAVWADALIGLPGDRALSALRELGRSATYPTVAEFLRHAGSSPQRLGEVVSVGEARFLPGTGWLGGVRPSDDDEERLAIEAPVDGAAAVRSIRSAWSARRRHEDGDR